MKNLIFAASVLAALHNITTAFSQAPETIALKGDRVFPEGIIALPGGDLLVGGFGDGSIQRIDKNNNVSYFSDTGANGMVIAVGMALDQKNKRLWVANFNFQTETGKPGSNLKVFDYETGKLLKTIPESFFQGAFFNEVTLDKNGNVYVSDTFAPNIWTASYSSRDARIFVSDASLLKNPSADQPFGLNGLTITPDNKYLIASVMNRTIQGGGTLVRIGLADKQVRQVTLGDDEATLAFSGSDGMFFYQDELWMVNVYSKAGAIVTARFTPDYSAARLTIRGRFQKAYDRPTSSAVRDGKLYTVNSQLNHIIDDKDGEVNTPPVLPFTIVAVSLKDLME